MTVEVRADSTELARLAGEVLAAAEGVTDGLTTAREAILVPGTAFGNSEAGSSVHLAHQAAAECGGTAAERLVEVLEGDVDRLYAVAFAYQKADRDAAADLCRRTGPGRQPC